MSAATVAEVVWVMLFLALACGALRAGVLNLAEYRRTLRLPPLDVSEIVSATLPERATPRRWPDLSAIDDVRVAAAYRDAAKELRDEFAIYGELLAIIGGAAVGALLPLAARGGFGMLWVAAAALLAALGIVMKRYGELKWAHAAGLYERRRRELMPEPERASRSWLARLVGG